MERWYGWPCSPGVRLVYVVQAVHDDITKGRISDPNHAYTFLTALISNQSSEVRVSTAAALYVGFSHGVLCVSRVVWPFAERVDEYTPAHLWAEEREHLPCGRCSSRM